MTDEIIEPEAPDTPEEVVDQVYPEPAKPLADGNPLVFQGPDVETIVILPPGYKTEHPALAAMETESAALRKQVNELSVEKEALTAELKTEKDAHAELSQKLDEIQNQEKVDVATEIATLRMEKGFLKEEDKDETIKTLSALNVEQLRTQLEDTRSLSASGDDEPDPVVPAEGDIAPPSDDEVRKRALRKEYFGREDLVGAE